MTPVTREVGTVQLHGGFKLWDCALLRSAGFSVDSLGAEASSDAQALRPALVPSASEARAERERSLERLCRSVVQSRFRAALVWQNPDLASRFPPERLTADKLSRNNFRDAKVLLRYLQRYATKNDTIGFFGPLAWVRVDSGDERPTRLCRLDSVERRARLEHAFAQTVADRLTAESGNTSMHEVVLPESLRVTDTGVLLADGSEHPIEAEFHRALHLCREPMLRHRLVAALCGDCELEIEDDEEAKEVVEVLIDRGLLRSGLFLPLWTLHPENDLARILAKLPDSRRKQTTLWALDELQSALRNLSAKAEEPVDLANQLGRIDELLRDCGSEDTRRNRGSLYGGRTPVYEDCVQAVDATIGAPFVRSISTGLSIVLESARWFCWRVHEMLHREATERFRCFGRSVVPFPEFFRAVESLFSAPGVPSEQTRTARAELCARWDEVVGPPETKRVRLDGRALAAAPPFPSVPVPWPMAAYHSPDLLLMLPNRELDQSVVLGEVHVARNSLFQQFSLTGHPEPAALFRAASRDGLGTSLFLVPSLADAGRVVEWPLHDGQILVSSDALPQDVPHLGSFRWVRPADIDVRLDEGELRFSIVTDTSIDLHFSQVFDWLLTTQVNSHFRMFSRKAHQPRVQIDDLIVQREAWSFSREELEFATRKDPNARLQGILTLAEEHALPRRVFVKARNEAKPFFMDFRDVLSMEDGMKFLRATDEATFSEFLPGPEQLALQDAAGRSYTSELRCVVVDSLRWKDPKYDRTPREAPS